MVDFIRIDNELVLVFEQPVKVNLQEKQCHSYLFRNELCSMKHWGSS